MCFNKFVFGVVNAVDSDDRRCFKLVKDVIISDDIEPVYESPLMYFSYRVGKTYTENSVPLYELNKALELRKGVFHSYSMLSNELIRRLVKYNKRGDIIRKYKILECVIPAGTPFWFNPETHQYASTSIRVERVIDPIEFEEVVSKRWDKLNDKFITEHTD